MEFRPEQSSPALVMACNCPFDGRSLSVSYAFGRRADTVFVELQKLLTPFGRVHFYTDAAGVYKRHLPATAYTVGKMYTQQIERKHLMPRMRTKRLVRKTLRFSKSVFVPDTVVGLFVNRYEFGPSA